MRKNESVISSIEEKVEDQNYLAVRQPKYRCPRCEFELDEAIINDGFCPRCAYDIAGIITLSEDLVDPQAEKEKAGMLAFHELTNILDNWCSGYLRVISERGVDWSLPHEFFQEFHDLMVPYITRLKKTGYSTPERMSAIGQKVVDTLHKLIEAIQQEEDLMRLTGQWNDQEEEIKIEWMDRMKKVQGLISC